MTERQQKTLIDLRSNGYAWAIISERLGLSADYLRKEYRKIVKGRCDD